MRIELDSLVVAALILLKKYLNTDTFPEAFVTYVVREYTGSYVTHVYLVLHRWDIARYHECVGKLWIKKKYYLIIKVHNIEEICDRECMEYLRDSRLHELVQRIVDCLFDSRCKGLSDTVYRIIKEYKKLYGVGLSNSIRVNNNRSYQ